MNPDVAAVKAYLFALQDRVCAALEQADGSGRFREDAWTRGRGPKVAAVARAC